MSKLSYSEYLERILAVTGGNIYWLDKHGIYQGCNNNVAEFFGFQSNKDILGKTDLELVESDNRQAAESFRADDFEVMRTGQAKYNIEEPPFVNKNGDTVYFLTTRVPIIDDDGEVLGVVGTSVDITARKTAEQALLIAKQQVDAAYQAKTEFLASMSHDVKTPLSGVISIAELLSSRMSNQDDKKILEDLGRCGQKLMSFFENCIELSKMDMTELQKVDQAFSIKKIADAIHELFLPSATAKNLRFEVTLDPALPSIMIGNQTNIYRVILNLIGNAMKFTSQGSVDLMVQCQERVDDDNIIIQIIVKDTGIGIPKDKQQIIFEKLQRLTPSYYNKQEGHGIGLYIVDQYVKSMSGTIEVVSDVGQGSAFIVTLPLKIAKDDVTDIVIPPRLTEKEVPAAAVEKPFIPVVSNAPELAKDAPRVLLVEDNPLIQAVTRQIIHSVGVAVDVAGTGKEALDFFIPGKYAVVYMDIGLPDMNGYQVSQQLRAIEAQQNCMQPTPIIALTAHASEDIKTFCIDAGMQGMLNKPLSRLQAQQILEHYVEKKSVVIDGLQQLESATTHSASIVAPLQIVDFQKCVTLMGSETRAIEILAMTMELLESTFIPEISTACDQYNDEELRKALHKFLGSLCYIGVPALERATLDFQTAVKEKLTIRPQAYQEFLVQVEKFKTKYLEMVKSNFK